MAETALANVDRVDTDIEGYLAEVGRVFRAFLGHDSECISWGVEAGGRRWFVKWSGHAGGIASLRRAAAVNAAVRHEALPRLHNAFQTPGGGLALVYDWVDGEALHCGCTYTAEQRRSDPGHPHVRFRGMPMEHVLAAIETIYDVHVLLADLGFVAVDLYDGCFLYDFRARRMHLCDLDEYRPGPFTLDADRLPGSSRFMAPEEFRRGATIDQVTNVFALGRTAMVLLGDSMPTFDAWRGTDAMRRVVEQATSPDPADRHASVRAFVSDWKAAIDRR